MNVISSGVFENPTCLPSHEDFARMESIVLTRDCGSRDVTIGIFVPHQFGWCDVHGSSEAEDEFMYGDAWRVIDLNP